MTLQPGLFESFDFDSDATKSAVAVSSSSRELLSVALMRKAIQEALPEHDPLNEFANLVLPHLVEKFILVTAKGGLFVEKQRAEGKSEAKLARYDRDQSLLSHILNGLFPVARIIRYLQEQQAPQFRRFDAQAYRLFCIGYTLHDIDKIPAIQARMEKEKLTLATNKTRFFALLDEQMQELGLATFFNSTDPTAYRRYLADIAYIIANTQDVWGTYRQTFDLDIQSDPRLLGILCDLTKLADHLAYLTPSPRDTAGDMSDHLLLDRLSSHTLRFVYHAVSENRGILTNVINSAAIAEIATDKRCVPLLFAPNGVVYLAPVTQYTLPNVETIAETAVEKLKSVCRKQVEESQGRVGFSVDRLKSFMKEADFCKLLFSPTERLRLGLKAAQSRARAKTFSTLISKLPTDVTFSELALRAEADMIAKFAHYAGRVLEQDDESLFQWFGLPDRVQSSSTVMPEQESATRQLYHDIDSLKDIDSRGGTIYRWYRVAAEYLQSKSGLSLKDGSLQQELALLTQQLCRLSNEDETVDKWVSLRRYVCDVMTVGGYVHQTADDLYSPYIFKEAGAINQRDFHSELHSYEFAKTVKGMAPCSLCTLPFQVQEQAETGVLFGPQVYTGRQLLHGTKLKRNICAICRIEQLLRMVLMQNVDVQGKEFEDKRKARYVYIYPSYFFTTETLKFVRKMIGYLQGFKFTEVKKQLIPENSYSVEWTQATFQQLQDLLLTPPRQLEDTLDESDEANDDDQEQTVETKQEGRYMLPAYPNDEPLTFLFFGIPHRKPPKRDITDTETWVTPTFLGLVLPMVLDAKVVISTSSTPLFVSGAEFPETVILDAPNPFVQHILAPSRAQNQSLFDSEPIVPSKHIAINFPRFRLDDLLPSLQTLTAAYALHLEAYADTSSKDFYRWGELSKVSASLATSPLYSFRYLERGFDRQTKDIKEEGIKFVIKQRLSRLYIQFVEQFLKGGQEAMSIPRELTMRYRAFYRAKSYKSNSILKPITEAADVLLRGDPRLLDDDDALKMAIVGTLSALMERIHTNKAEGWHNRELKRIDANGKIRFDFQAERTNIITFTDYFVDHVFARSLRHDRSALVGRQLNLLKNACEAVYVSLEAEKPTEPESEDTSEEETETTNS